MVKQFIKENYLGMIISSLVAMGVYSILSIIDKHWNLMGTIISAILALLIYCFLKYLFKR